MKTAFVLLAALAAASALTTTEELEASGFCMACIGFLKPRMDGLASHHEFIGDFIIEKCGAMKESKLKLIPQIGNMDCEKLSSHISGQVKNAYDTNGLTNEFAAHKVCNFVGLCHDDIVDEVSSMEVSEFLSEQEEEEESRSGFCQACIGVLKPRFAGFAEHHEHIHGFLVEKCGAFKENVIMSKIPRVASLDCHGLAEHLSGQMKTAYDTNGLTDDLAAEKVCHFVGLCAEDVVKSDIAELEEEVDFSAVCTACTGFLKPRMEGLASHHDSFKNFLLEKCGGIKEGFLGKVPSIANLDCEGMATKVAGTLQHAYDQAGVHEEDAAHNICAFAGVCAPLPIDE